MHKGNYEGGVSFASSTWARYRRLYFPSLPARAFWATRAQQIVLAEKVLELEGPGAWPKCSYVVGMR